MAIGSYHTRLAPDLVSLEVVVVKLIPLALTVEQLLDLFAHSLSRLSMALYQVLCQVNVLALLDWEVVSDAV